MELPGSELSFDGLAFLAGGGQADRQPAGPAPHLLGPGQALLDHPSAVAGLERLGQSAEVAEGEGRDAGPDGEFLPMRSPIPSERAVSSSGRSKPRPLTSNP
jgi:hypothetical protein